MLRRHREWMVSAAALAVLACRRARVTLGFVESDGCPRVIRARVRAGRRRPGTRR
ncbi:MAG TPA: hypothetical protein VGW35_04565 [Methylomirabilota bacterium]|nr:hypothetical protein [Methylomirabilota bacterium]